MPSIDSPSSAAAEKLTESEFLRLQAEKAKAKISQSLKEAQAAFGRDADPRKAIGQHPWIALGSAAIAGFAAAAAAIPSKREQELRRIERVQRALHPEPPQETNGSAKKSLPKEALGVVILRELIQLLRPILMAAITAGIKGQSNPPAPDSTEPPVAQGPDKVI